MTRQSWWHTIYSPNRGVTFRRTYPSLVRVNYSQQQQQQPRVLFSRPLDAHVCVFHPRVHKPFHTMCNPVLVLLCWYTLWWWSTCWGFDFWLRIVLITSRYHRSQLATLTVATKLTSVHQNRNTTDALSLCLTLSHRLAYDLIALPISARVRSRTLELRLVTETRVQLSTTTLEAWF